MNKVSIGILLAGLVLGASSFVGSHSDIKTVMDLFEVQNFFGLLGVCGSVLMGWLSKSPVTPGPGMLPTVTGNGTVTIPKP